MKWLKQYGKRQILFGILWILVGCSTIVLLTAAVNENERRVCKGVEIEITGASKHLFLDQAEVMSIIRSYTNNKIENEKIRLFDLQKIEKIIERNVWVNNAELFVDINGILQVRVDEREPIARIFTENNFSYYIDSSLKILPLSDKVSARVPVFTGFPAETAVLNKEQAALMNDVRSLANYIAGDKFLDALIDQIDIYNNKFSLVPKVGDQIIEFGDAQGYEEKFDKLKLFYQQVMTKTNWNRYSEISLQFRNQIVAKIRTKEDVKADSLRTIQLMKLIVSHTEKMAGDTSMVKPSNSEAIDAEIDMILQSVQRDEEPEIQLNLDAPPPIAVKVVEPVKKPEPKPEPKVEKKVAPKPVVKTEQKKQTEKPKEQTKPAVKKPEVKSQPAESKQPKAIMQKKTTTENDY